MHRFIKPILFIGLSLSASILMATPPRQLITHNTTDVESNAFVAGTIASRHPTKAHTDSKVVWTEVRMACFGHTVNNQCSALIKMGTGPDDGGSVDLGTVMVDLNTGIITPSRLSANGYTMIVNGPGETTLIKD